MGLKFQKDRKLLRAMHNLTKQPNAPNGYIESFLHKDLHQTFNRQLQQQSYRRFTLFNR